MSGGMRLALLSLAAAATLHGGSCKLNDLEARFISQPDAETAREYHEFNPKNCILASYRSFTVIA